MRLVDLTVPITSRRIPGLSDFQNSIMSAQIQYMDHKSTVPSAAAVLGCKPEHLQDGLGYAGELMTLTTHVGTHLDAPWHFGPMSQGNPAMTIDQIPLDWCFADGVVLDVRHLEPRARIEIADLQQALDKLPYRLKPFDIVLVRTGWDRFLGKPEYLSNYPGMTRESTLWLVEQGVHIIGIDTLGFDRPFEVMADEFKKTGNAAVLWESHYAGTTRPYCHIEKLANLGHLPAVGFRLCCFPIPVERASAGWIRAVAILPE
jgi:kynurenine formamidase